MGIVKVAGCVPRAKCGYSCGDEDITREEKMLLQSFPIHECDDYEHAEINCELAKSGGQICNVPYGFYDLPELNDVLSLETWNLCLTEDDRFRLTADLPDMDQLDFFLTMKELFSGSDMFFGSPVRSFFHRLNGGFYSLEVSHARELLMIFQRRRYYHFLKSYHDAMISKFTSMDKLWPHGMSTSQQAKVHICNDRRYESLPRAVDLNGSPFNRSLSTISDFKADILSPLKRAKCMDRTITSHCSAKRKGIVHRAKSIEMNSFKSPIFHAPNEFSTKFIRLPKGVLKIKTDCASLNDRNEGMHHTPERMTADQLGIPASSLSPCASALSVHGFAMNSGYDYHMNTIKSTFDNLHASPYQREGALDTYPILVKSPFGVQNMVPEELKRVNSSELPSTFHQSSTKQSPAFYNEAFSAIEVPHEKNLLKNFGQRNAIIPESSPDSFTRTIDGDQTNGYSVMHNLKTAESISDVLTLGTDICAPYKQLSEQSKIMHRQPKELNLKTPANNSVTEIEEGYRYPYTYKRRKLQKRLDLDDAVKKSTMVDTESMSTLASIENAHSNGNQTLKIGS
ncbi:hypothetical protein GUJ93_ZPchr0008g12287 [Zizania palustris]|uniref:DEUBAD domain-containing protein n=1 Tax=Zizania palustris TaxID=103762 RepID=A0A8J5RL74_ZIZPA|nr:hypothetical protein GUJ93_ZPchr0008g12287 [Zizania palustris]